jgi:hypothetical protein
LIQVRTESELLAALKTGQVVLRTCTFEDCETEHYAHGLCRKHHKRAARHGDPSVVKRSGPRGPRAESTPTRILDILETDGGWLHTDWIYDAFPQVPDKTISRALFRLRDKGLIESRPTPGVTQGWRQPPNEWRAV